MLRPTPHCFCEAVAHRDPTSGVDEKCGLAVGEGSVTQVALQLLLPFLLLLPPLLEFLLRVERGEAIAVDAWPGGWTGGPL